MKSQNTSKHKYPLLLNNRLKFCPTARWISSCVTFLWQVSLFSWYLSNASNRQKKYSVPFVMRMKSNTHPGKVVISKKCLQKGGKLLFQMKLKTELGQLLPIQKACPCGVTAAVDFPELWNIVVLFFFIHPIAGWTRHAKKQKQWYTYCHASHILSLLCSRQCGPGPG